MPEDDDSTEADVDEYDKDIMAMNEEDAIDGSEDD